MGLIKEPSHTKAITLSSTKILTLPFQEHDAPWLTIKMPQDIKSKDTHSDSGDNQGADVVITI